jgi:hypothetical protein
LIGCRSCEPADNNRVLELDRPLPKADWARQLGGRNGVSMPPAPHPAEESVANAGPWEPAVLEVVSYQHLGDNWDGYGAEAPSREVLESAIGLAYAYLQNGVEPPYRVSPGVAGSVIFEWQQPDGTYIHGRDRRAAACRSHGDRAGKTRAAVGTSHGVKKAVHGRTRPRWGQRGPPRHPTVLDLMTSKTSPPTVKF